MGILDRAASAARNLLLSPADRRLAAIERELWQDAPKPDPRRAWLAQRSPSSIVAAEPWSGDPQPPARTPEINWMQDQPAPPPGMYTFKAGYSDHTYQSFAAPLGFEQFSLDAIRSAVAAHRQGIFWQSSLLMIAILGFAPVQAALSQAIAPILDGTRQMRVNGGDRGLSRILAEEIREQLVPGDGLEPSRFLPPELWGTMAIYRRMMGFAVLQHVDGDPDSVLGYRPRFTRIWEPWAINAYRSPRKLIAQTVEGSVDITNDGKFTVVGDTDEPWLFDAAITCLGEEALGGKITQEARNNWIEFFGQPKLYATLPEKIGTEGAAGNAFFAALEQIYGPSGRGIVPFGTKIEEVSIGGEGTNAFKDALLDQIIHIFMVLTGSAGTIGSGGPTGAGPYTPQKGGFWNVRGDLVARPVLDMTRAVNRGHVKPYCDQNYGQAIVEAKARGQWKGYPCIEIPLPDPERDERIASVIEREKARVEIIRERRSVGIVVEQEDSDKIADALELPHVTLGEARGEITDKDIEAKNFSPDEVRAAKGYGPLPNGVGSVEQLARERAEGRDKTGVVRQTETEDVKPAEGAAPAPPAEEAA